MMAPLHGTQSEPHRPSAAELTATRLSDAIFEAPLGMSSIKSSVSNPLLEKDSNSLEPLLYLRMLI